MIVALGGSLALLWFWLRELRLHRHQQAIAELLDGADNLEAQLQECRERMQRLREMLTVLPEEMSAGADAALSADAKVQAALKDVLAHRLWIKQHAAGATQAQLDAARSALAQSRATLSSLLLRLADIAADLERAQASAQSAGRRNP